MKVALSTDTSCTINKELAKKLNIFVFPLNVIVNGEEFLDGISIDQDQLNKDMREGKIIKTSTPPPADVVSYFEKLFKEGYDYIIHFTISSKLSSMNDLFNTISRDYFENKIIVIDSYSVSSLMLSHVLYAYDELQKGATIEAITKGIEERKKDNIVVFIPENLTALKNGGRISPAIAALGNMIGLKPILSLKDGGLEKDSMTRNTKKSLSEQIEKLSSTYPIEKFDYTIVTFDANESLLQYLVEQIENKFTGYSAPVLPLSINVCAHTGPGTIGIVVSPKINGKSLTSFSN